NARSKSPEINEICLIDSLYGLLYMKEKAFSQAQLFYQSALANCQKAGISTLAEFSNVALKAIALDIAEQKLPQNYQLVEIGMTKSKVLNLLGLQPSTKKSISLKQGIFDCWGWSSYYLLFLDGTIVETGLKSCPF